MLTGVAALDGRKVVIGTGKLGRVIGFDPGGNVLWDTPVGMHKNDDRKRFEGEVTVLPGALGGVVTPIAIADGLVFAAVVNAPGTYRSPEQSSGGEAQLGASSPASKRRCGSRSTGRSSCSSRATSY